MRNALKLALHTTLALLARTASAQATADTATIGLRLDAMTFFDNKEFTSNIKKGYTLPGLYIEPALEYTYGAFDLRAGIHTAYLAGADTAKRLIPTLLIAYSPTPWFELQLGTLPRSLRRLPEPLYKPEKLFISLPPTGLEFILNRPNVLANMWIDWERYIKHGSPFQEEFMVGLSGQYSTNGEANIQNPNGFSSNLYAVITHAGGQIDTTNLPVTSVANIGIAAAFGLPLGTRTSLGVRLSAYVSSDISPNPHLEFERGHALHGTIWLKTLKGLMAEAGYWQAKHFINPRGEELFGSVSTISSAFNQPHRQLITAQASYTVGPIGGFELRFGAGLYADINQIKANSSQGAADYYYTLTLRYNGQLFRKKLTKTP